MLRTALRPCLTALAAVLAAAALSACEGRLDAADASERTIPSGSRRAEDAGRAGERERAADDRDAERAEDGDHDERKDDERPTLESGGAIELYAEQSEASDLEFSEGLPEPPQGRVVPSPAPWMPPSGGDAEAKPEIDDVWPDKGPVTGGERITIRGKNLKAAQVVFGLVPAQILTVNEAHDTLVVAAPAAEAGPVAIVVTNRDGNYALSSGTFQYYN